MPDVWDPAALDRVRHLHLHARQAVAGLHQGAQRSIRLGHDVEFMDYKPYDVGDALRDLDWRVLARSDRLVVRRYRAETELEATIVLDASADLGSRPGKFEAAIRLAATLAYLLHLGGEPVGLVIVAGDGVAARVLPARRGRAWIARIFATLASVRPAGRAMLDHAFRDVGRRLGLRTLVAVISDFMEVPTEWVPSLDALVRHRVDLRAFHVYDPDELSLAGDSPVWFRHPETGERRPMDRGAARAAFAPVVANYFAEVERAVQARRGHHYPVAANAELGPLLARFLRGAA